MSFFLFNLKKNFKPDKHPNKKAATPQKLHRAHDLKCISRKIFLCSSLILLVSILLPLNIIAKSGIDSAEHWVGTWGAAPYLIEPRNMPPSPGLSNNSLRQVVRVSIGGVILRVKFSNIKSSEATMINSVSIAASVDGKGMIDESGIKELKFNDNRSVKINAYSSVVSDPVKYNLKPGMRLAITIFYGETSASLTGHVGSRTDSFILQGDKTKAQNFNDAIVTAHWYTISAVEVLAPGKAAAVAAFGDSITDGYGLSGGLQNRWTDALSEKLLSNPATSQIGVLNMGIGATHVLKEPNSGISRYKQDILDQTGVRWVIIFYGVNDICAANASAEKLIDAYKQFVTEGHAHNLKVYGATITPFFGNSYFTPAHEAVRQKINEWIRTSGVFDAVIDFDKTVRDPNDTKKFRQELKKDGLHPNVLGYKVMGESIDLKLFIK